MEGLRAFRGRVSSEKRVLEIFWEDGSSVERFFVWRSSRIEGSTRK